MTLEDAIGELQAQVAGIHQVLWELENRIKELEK